jgi:hypothetical protein
MKFLTAMRNNNKRGLSNNTNIKKNYFEKLYILDFINFCWGFKYMYITLHILISNYYLLLHT